VAAVRLVERLAEVLEQVAEQAGGADDGRPVPRDGAGRRVEVDPQHRRRAADQDLVGHVGRDPQAPRPRQHPDLLVDAHRHEPARGPRQLVRRVVVAAEAVAVGQRERAHRDAARAGLVMSLCRHPMSR
jgi:hypothetical protein